VSAGGVWGTAELLMRSLELTQLEGLWEHTVLPIFTASLYIPSGTAVDCANQILTGNLHTTGRVRAQAEFIVCPANPDQGRAKPILLAAWVISMNATERGSISLQSASGARVSANLQRGSAEDSLEAVDQIYAELKSRYGSDLVTPDASLRVPFRVTTHHLGGGLRPAASAGRVNNVPNVFIGDMSAYESPVFGYTTGAAAVAGITAAMRAVEEGATCTAPPFPPLPPRAPPFPPSTPPSPTLPPPTPPPPTPPPPVDNPTMSGLSSCR